MKRRLVHSQLVKAFGLVLCLALLIPVSGLLLAAPSATSFAAPAANFENCALYPIALSTQSLVGVNIGDVLPDILNGALRGNFGWLSWTGDLADEPTLVTSLTPPGNSNTYINPNDPADHLISVGDWVRGKPGVTDSSSVRAALDTLKTIDIDVPVWDTSSGSGNNAQYHVRDFARLRITDYQTRRAEQHFSPLPGI